jgi:hypothetical protein
MDAPELNLQPAPCRASGETSIPPDLLSEFKAAARVPLDRESPPRLRSFLGYWMQRRMK